MTRLTPRDLVDDPVGDALQQVIGQPGPVGGHRVVGGDGAEHDRVGVGALIALHADRADDRQYAERLPELALETCGANLLLQDRVRLPHDFEALPGDLAQPRGLRGRAPGKGCRQTNT